MHMFILTTYRELTAISLKIDINPQTANHNQSAIYANSVDPDETPSNSAFHLDTSSLTLRQHFHQF